MIIKEIDWRDPVAAFAPLAAERGAVLLGAGAKADGGRWSFMCVGPRSVIERREGKTLIDGAASDVSPFVALQALHQSRRLSNHAHASPLLSGVVGFAGYECGALLENSVPGLPSDQDQPDFLFAAYDVIASFDHRTRRAFIAAPDGISARRFEAALGRDSPKAPAPLFFSGSNFSPARYRAAVTSVIDRILDGAIYQANISHRLHFKADAPVDAYALYAAAAAQSAATHAAFLNLGRSQVVSLSPERFFSVAHDPQGLRIRAEPIKGTRPRGATEAEDRRLASELQSSAKDRAENIMIADLTRNDLSRICADGSIREEAICDRMTLATVHHLVSRISGLLKPGVDAPEALAALFPCGSVTGAPKIEAMRTIAAIEGVARGPYCGAIGYIDDRGGADFSVAIRTAIVRGARVELPVGGGVTLRSDPAAEFEETLDKAEWFLRIAGVSRAALS